MVSDDGYDRLNMRKLALPENFLIMRERSKSKSVTYPSSASLTEVGEQAIRPHWLTKSWSLTEMCTVQWGG
ncbi:hypothetical protein KUIN1_09650 [Pseudomonas sp. KUIN-1]|nr:hypothetical protein KUIN1_09650 [Pseudomonas sp. KUIN-1]